MTIDHYENFPVASWLMPAHLRPAIRVIYHFARSADDIADEGDDSAEIRLDKLHQYEEQLHKIVNKQDSDLALFTDLALVIEKYALPTKLFFALISAFKQDIVTKRYQNFSSVLDYCNRSANPVGRLMLHLYGAVSEENLRCSDQICTALQLINFWQDVSVDWQKDRVYLPQEDLARFGVNENTIRIGTMSELWTEMMYFQTDRARNMMLDGAQLCHRLDGRIGFELRLMVQGGLRILEKIEQVNGNVFTQRPIISKQDFPILIWRALRMR
jgi:squalene synthase HpnC